MKLCRKTENLNQFSIGCVSASLCLCVCELVLVATVVMWCDGKCFYFFFLFRQKNSAPHTLSDSPIFIPYRSLCGVFLFSARVIFAKVAQKAKRARERKREVWKESNREKTSEQYFIFRNCSSCTQYCWMVMNEKWFSVSVVLRIWIFICIDVVVAVIVVCVYVCATKISRKIFDLVEYYTHDRMFARLLTCFVRSLACLLADAVMYMHVHKNTVHIVFRCGLPPLHQFSPRVRHSIGLNNHRWKKY